MGQNIASKISIDKTSIPQTASLFSVNLFRALRVKEEGVETLSSRIGVLIAFLKRVSSMQTFHRPVNSRID